MKLQLAGIVAIVACSFIAVPLFYGYRMNNIVFAGGIVAFVGAPIIAGINQKQIHRSTILTAAIFLLLCPAVYVFIDQLAAQYEKWRDAFFLATGSTMVFVATSWIANSLKLHKKYHIATAVLALLSSIATVITLLLAVLYLE